MKDTDKKRRAKGPSPRGKFEESKSVALAIIDAGKDAERRKTETLKAARLARMSEVQSHGK